MPEISGCAVSALSQIQDIGNPFTKSDIQTFVYKKWLLESSCVPVLFL